MTETTASALNLEKRKLCSVLSIYTLTLYQIYVKSRRNAAVAGRGFSATLILPCLEVLCLTPFSVSFFY